MGAAQGITPAYAGKSETLGKCAALEEDHPRLRGEKNLTDLEPADEAGSPPLTRGKAAEAVARVGEERITPAYAGKSQAAAPRVRPPPDHPRLRGEKASLTPASVKP